MNSLKLGSLVLAVALSTYVNAQERPVNVAYRDADVRTVIQQVGQLTESRVVIDDGVEGKVTFLPNGPMTTNEFRRAILSHLSDLGYEITNQDGVLLVGPAKP
jgi:type II secretory pathway component GspD/PulD (secretin)